MKQNFRSGLYSTLLATLLGVVLTTGPRPELGMGMGMGMGGAGDDLAGPGAPSSQIYSLRPISGVQGHVPI